MNQLAVDLVSEIGRRISSVTEDTSDSIFLFKRLYPPKGKCGLLSSHLYQLFAG